MFLLFFLFYLYLLFLLYFYVKKYFYLLRKNNLQKNRFEKISITKNYIPNDKDEIYNFDVKIN